jgi:Uma2 family endonuclease
VVIDPILLVEVLSPTNEAETRAKVWAYASTQIAAELIRRGLDGGWPANPSLLGEEDRLSLESIGFECPLPAIYEGTRFIAAPR